MVKVISLKEIKNETIDLEKIPIDEVFEQLLCSREGLNLDFKSFNQTSWKRKKKAKYRSSLVYVESSVVGYGYGGYHGHCTG